jgi:hypothetical protein
MSHQDSTNSDQKASPNVRMWHAAISILLSVLVCALGIGLAFALEVRDVKYRLPLNGASADNVSNS